MLDMLITNKLPAYIDLTDRGAVKAWGGLGLVNVRTRLEQVSGVDGKLSTRHTADGYCEVSISLPLTYARMNDAALLKL